MIKAKFNRMVDLPDVLPNESALHRHDSKEVRLSQVFKHCKNLSIFSLKRRSCEASPTFALPRTFPASPVVARLSRRLARVKGVRYS